MARNISVCDVTLRKAADNSGSALPFRIKIEVAKLLSGLGVSVIETSPILNGKTDYFLVKSLASAVSASTVSVPVDILDAASPATAWDALKDAVHPRLQVPVPVSTVQMEYFCHKKPEGILKLIADNVSACAALCPEVEFVAGDFGRSDPEFLMSAIETAVGNGAGVITVADAAGNLLEDEFFSSIRRIRESLPAEVRLGVYCSNDLYLADSCAISAVRAGADEVKVVSMGNPTVSLRRFPRILNAKTDVCDAVCGVKLTELDHVIAKIHTLCEGCRAKSPTSLGLPSGSDEIRLSVHDDMASVLNVVRSLGYDLSEEDGRRVYDAFVRLSSGDEVIGAKEIDAIVASVAFQVPPTYLMESFVINTGNVMTPTCHIRLRKGDEMLESVCIGDGPVDAAFLAIEKVVGRHFELDDFKVRSVTEGREAMGETIVRLRHDGRLYSGRGVSKDIIASGVLAYLNAVNKIAYEEVQV